MAVQRWWALLVVAAAVTFVLALKAPQAGQQASESLPLSTPASALQSPSGSPIGAGTRLDGEDPFPESAVEQVEWVLRHKKPAMLLFHSTMCRPCRMMDALVQMVRRDYEPGVVFIEVIIDSPANAELLQWAKVGSIPASYFLSRTGEGRRVVGLMKQQDLRSELARLAGGQ